MTKLKVTISLDSEIAEKLRLQSIEKYHNSRSMSRLIEDLATGAAEAKKPEACSILAPQSEESLIVEAGFNGYVEKIAEDLSKIQIYIDLMSLGKPVTVEIDEVVFYFALKEACELRINKQADMINYCWSCKGLNGPLPKYPDAGKNFELYATLKSD
jgi:hypothetical protein